jgi:hypothetical protein
VSQRRSVMVVAIAFTVIVVTIVAAYYGYRAFEAPAGNESPVAPGRAEASTANPPPSQPADDGPAAKPDVPPVATPAAPASEGVPASPELRGEAERIEITRAIQQWAAAFTKRDVKALSQVRPLSDAEVRTWRKTFSNMASYKLTVRITDTPRVIDDEASVPVQEVASYTSKLGTGAIVTDKPVNATYRLRKVGGDWQLLAPTTPMPRAGR